MFEHPVQRAETLLLKVVLSGFLSNTFDTESIAEKKVVKVWSGLTDKQSIGAPRSGALALRSGAVLPERGRSATPGSWPGALSERRSGKRPERTWSASAPTALQQAVKFIRSTEKFRAARRLEMPTKRIYFSNAWLWLSFNFGQTSYHKRF